MELRQQKRPKRVEAMTSGTQHVASGQAAREAAVDAAADGAADVAAVASLDEPTRRRIYDHVRAHAVPVSRDDVADALEVPRRTAAFHLDRLAEQGLLAVSFARRSGRSGPGAGRPAKLYQRSAREVSVSLPPRHYDLAGRLLAGAVVEAQHSGEPPREVLDRRARDFGRALAAEQSGDDDTGVLMDSARGPRLRAAGRGRRHRPAQLPVPCHGPGTHRAGLRHEPASARGCPGRSRHNGTARVP